MEPETPWWITLIVNWLPFILFVVLFGVIARRTGLKARTSSGRTMVELYEEQVIEERRSNELLERIAVALEKGAHR